MFHALSNMGKPYWKYYYPKAKRTFMQSAANDWSEPNADAGVERGKRTFE